MSPFFNLKANVVKTNKVDVYKSASICKIVFLEKSKFSANAGKVSWNNPISKETL